MQHLFVSTCDPHVWSHVVSFCRPICLTSKCTHILLPSLHPPRSGAAVRGFAAAVSCYDVKTMPPRPARVLSTLSIACNLTPNLLCHPPNESPRHKVHAGVPHHLDLQREGDREHTTYSQKPHSHISPPLLQSTHSRINRWFADTCAESNTGCQHIPALGLWTSQRCRRGMSDHMGGVQFTQLRCNPRSELNEGMMGID